MAQFIGIAAAAAKLLQSCLTLCNPIDGSPPGSSVHGTAQARTLEWVAISSSNAWKWKVKVKSLSRVWLLATPWTAAYRAPPSMGFSGQEYWSGVPLPSPVIGIRHTLTSTFSSFLLCPRSSFAIVYFDIDLEQTSSLLTALVSLLSRIQNQDHVILLPSACFLGFILRVNILLVLKLKVPIIHKKF